MVCGITVFHKWFKIYLALLWGQRFFLPSIIIHTIHKPYIWSLTQTYSPWISIFHNKPCWGDFEICQQDPISIIYKVIWFLLIFLLEHYVCIHKITETIAKGITCQLWMPVGKPLFIFSSYRQCSIYLSKLNWSKTFRSEVVSDIFG